MKMPPSSRPSAPEPRRRLLRALALGAWFLFAGSSPAANITPLGEAPDWSRLDRWQETMTRDEFSRLLDSLYAPRNAAAAWIRIDDGEARIRADHDLDHLFYILRFAPPADADSQGQTEAVPPAALAGMRIAIDPGHIGGEFAALEQRHFQLGTDAPVREGEIVLEVARRLADRLRTLGAIVLLLREDNQPVTSARPDDFLGLARERLSARSHARAAVSENEVRSYADLLFYRVSEIRARARRLDDLGPVDLILALHLNAEPWPPGDARQLVQRDHAHVLVNGAYSAAELAWDDVRLEMLDRLLARYHETEIAVGGAIAQSLATHTGLPPFRYSGSNALQVHPSGYLWARNLLANRIYQAPVVYLEPYVANSSSTYPRLQAFLNGSSDALIEEYTQAILRALAPNTP